MASLGKITSKHQYAKTWLVALTVAGCGSLPGLNPKQSTRSAGASADQTAAPAPQAIASLDVLSPGELAQKIYSAFGGSMTMVNQGDANNPKRVDYLLLNQANFVGSISNDPSNRYASSFSISYFLALAGLADVVGKNYATALGRGGYANDCRTVDGAGRLLAAVSPTVSSAELPGLAASLVTACSENAAAAISAVVQSYSMALKATR